MKNKNKFHKDEFLKLKLGNFKFLNLLKRYNALPQRYNLYIINNIIFNINSRKVSHFKDFLIYDDPNDFMQRFYYMKESVLYLEYYISFYEENNKIFPNYYCLPESKYLYLNIQQKQNILNNIENRNIKFNSKGHSYNTIFSSSIKRSIYNESVYPSNSINSTGDHDLKKLIKVINDNYSTISYICKKERSLNTISSNNLGQKNHIKKEIGKFTINNKISSCQKNLLYLKKKEKDKMIDIKRKIENNEGDNNSNCLSDREKNVNSKKTNSKDNKDCFIHKRIMTHYNKELMNVCRNIKNTIENGKNSTETKEKLKSLIKTIKYIIKKNNNNVNKNINHNHTITEIDNINNINININTSNKISITSRNLDKNMNVKNKIIKSVLNSNIQTKKNNKNNNRKVFVNQTENLKNCLRKKMKIEQGNNSYKVVCNRLCSLRNEYKGNKNLLNHIQTNSNVNYNLLTEIKSKINKYHTILSNNNSVSFNSPFKRKKKVNKSTSIESFPRLQISTQKKHNKKILIKNNSKRKRKTLTDVCCIKENLDKNNNNKKYNKYAEFEHIKELSDFPTQINFGAHKQFIKKYKNISKKKFPNTIQKVKSYKKENRSTFLAKSNINKNINNTNSTIFQNLNCSKKFNLGLRSRNNTTLNSLNINLTGIKNLKMINNLYTIVNIYGSSRNKNNIISGLKTERINNKLSNGTYFFDNKKLFKKLNASNIYTYLNKKKQSNNNLYNNIIKKFNNKTNSSINNTESTFSINKTSNNFNHILKKNILHNNTYNYFAKIKKIRFKNVRPMLIKKYDKEIIYPQNSDRIPFGNKNESSKM